MTGLAVFPRKARSLRLHHQNFRLCTIVRTIRCGLFNVKFRSQPQKDQIWYEGKGKMSSEFFLLFIGYDLAALFCTFHRLVLCSTVLYFLSARALQHCFVLFIGYCLAALFCTFCRLGPCSTVLYFSSARALQHCFILFIG